MFHVGHKVVCVHDEWGGGGMQFPCPLIKNAVYTVVSISDGMLKIGFDCRETTADVRLLEVENPDPRVGFDPARFRPAVERKTDISIFTEMLNTKQRELTQ